MSELPHTEELNNWIAILQVKQRMEYNELKNQLQITVDTIRPENILKDTFTAYIQFRKTSLEF